MAYSFDFKDNVVYGADHINAIRTSILTKGVVEESADSCKVSAVGGVATVQQGQAIFSDGSRIEIDSDGVEREYVTGQKNYVYLYNNILAGVCEVIVSTAAPEGDFVILAEINELDEVTDKREFAQLKTADVQRYISSFGATVNLDNKTGATASITLPKSNCSMVEFDMSFHGLAWWRIRIFPKEEGHTTWQYPNGVFYAGEVMDFKCGGKNRTVRFTVSGNLLTVVVESISEEDSGYCEVLFSGYCVR